MTNNMCMMHVHVCIFFSSEGMASKVRQPSVLKIITRHLSGSIIQNSCDLCILKFASSQMTSHTSAKLSLKTEDGYREMKASNLTTSVFQSAETSTVRYFSFVHTMEPLLTRTFPIANTYFKTEKSTCTN